MAKYRLLMIQDGTGWHLMSPSNPWEALRIAWMLWRQPDRVAALVGVKEEYTLKHWTVESAGRQAMRDLDRHRAEAHTDHPLRHYDRTCPACNATPNTN
jgi:hypothetical protein